MNTYTPPIKSDNRAIGIAIGICRFDPFRPLRVLSLLLISLWLFLTDASAQTGLPLNFSSLPNPLAAPQLYYLESDKSIPLGDKIPLILIHGIDLFSMPPSVSADGWINFLLYFYTTPSLSSRYKIYRFAYQSNQVSVATLGSYLSQLMNFNETQLAQKDIVVLAHSMGGLVARRLMEEQRQTTASKWNQSVIRLITLATPHHGTPAANDSLLVWLPFPHFVGALGTKLSYEFATLDADINNTVFRNIPYNQVNRSDLLWDNYDGLFQSGFEPEEQNPSTAALNSIANAKAYDYKLIAYCGSIANGSIIHSGHDAGLSTTADILANGLGIPSDGIVPIDSAWFTATPSRLGGSQLRFFDDYDHYQMMQGKILAPVTDPLFTSIKIDLVNALPPNVPPPTISSVSPRYHAPLPASQTYQLTIQGTGFTGNSKLRFTRLDDNYTYPDGPPASSTTTQLLYDISVGLSPRSWSVKVIDNGLVSNSYTFYVTGATLSSLSISGPASVAENGTASFTARAILSDGTQQDVTPSSSWSVTGPASIGSSSGALTAGGVSADTTVTVTATYQSGGVTKTAAANVTIINGSGGGAGQTQELITNGGFESGAFPPWSFYQAIVGSKPLYYHSGSRYAVLGEDDLATDLISQDCFVPSNATKVTLSFWVWVYSDDLTGVEHDTLDVELTDTNNIILRTVDHKSNVSRGASDGQAHYVQKTFDLTSLKGQTVRLAFLSQTNATGFTSFKIDDVSVIADIPPPVTLTGLSIKGSSAVTESSSAYYSATAIFSDGSTQDNVSASWSANSSFASINSTGVLTTFSVNADTTVTVSASYVLGGVTRSATKTVTIVNVAPVFSYLSIRGPSSLNESTSGQFSATAVFSDGSTTSAFPNWSVDSGVATIANSGLLSAGSVAANTQVTISGVYTISGVQRTSSQTVTIVDVPVPVTLQSLGIGGPSSLNENSTALYTATATFSDGSTQTVVPTWSVNSSATSISLFGLLSAGEVATNTPVTITASYNSGGVNRTASQAVTLVNVPDAVPPALAISSHTDNQSVSASPISVAGTASDSGRGNSGISSVTVNGVGASGGTASGGNAASWSKSVTLSPGANTITVIARDGSANQNTTTVSITVSYQPDTVATPTITPNGGSYADGVVVTLACATPGATIRYTTDGNDPSASSAIYNGTVTLTSSATVKAKAFKSGSSDSVIASAIFTVTPTGTVATPTISPTGGSFADSVPVTLACATSEATIYYTINGSDPTTSSTVYGGTFTLTSTATVKAKAFKTGSNDSAIASATFSVTPILTRVIALSGNLTFGSVAVGMSAQRTLTISNNGNSPLTVSSINFPSGFSGSWNSGTIAAGSSQNVMVTFTPPSNGDFDGALTVNCDATGGSNVGAVFGRGSSGGPPNDNFSSSQVLVGSSGLINEDTAGATLEAGEPAHGNTVTGGASVWFLWVAPQNGTAIIDTIGTGFDTILHVYTGSVLTNLASIRAGGAVEPATVYGFWTSTGSFQVKAGTEYRIAVDGYGGETGPLVLHWKVQPFAGRLSFNAASYTVREDAGQVVVTVKRLGSTHGAVTVRYMTEYLDGTATEGEDYTARDGLLEFADRQASKTFTVPILNDGTMEGKERFQLVLYRPTGGAIASGDSALATVEITDDESFAAYKGTYLGLIEPASLSGKITLSLNPSGAFTVSLALGGKTYSFHGPLTRRGDFSVAIPNTGLRLNLRLAVNTATDQMTGTITQGDVVLANLVANRTPLGFTTRNPVPHAGLYTILLPADSTNPEATYPQGSGYGTLTVAATGSARFAGVLGDGTATSEGGALSVNGEFPLYVALYRAQGSVSGWLTLHDAAAANHVEGTLNWFKPATTTTMYPAKFSGQIAVAGSIYVAPPTRVQILDSPSGHANFAVIGGNLTTLPATKDVTIDAKNRIKIVGTERFSMSMTAGTGLFSGTFYDTNRKARTFRGAVLQKQNTGSGLFNGIGQTGRVDLDPTP